MIEDYCRMQYTLNDMRVLFFFFCIDGTGKFDGVIKRNNKLQISFEIEHNCNCMPLS
jgi:hypothetical protein